MSGVVILISIIIIIKPFSLTNISSSNQKDPAFTTNIVSHTFAVLPLPTFPASKLDFKYKKFKN